MSDTGKRTERSRTALNRRRFVGVASGALVAPVIPAVALGQEYSTPQSGTPVASPAASEVDEDALYELSQKLVGGGNLSRDAVGPLAKLIGGDADLAAGFEELVKLDDPTSEDARAALSENAQAASTNILLYWYDGYFGDHPVENRADILFGLPVWSTVPYITMPTVCKGFGYWATEVKDVATPEAGS
ncbi:MAG TPA: hypothetical protein VNZ58_11030 [Thermomicrobiales bacterium]|nr:hypothetical protein [Thermomicrobiales bacterium]